MSYCRFSSDNWRCDLYVYESTEGGYMIHVAGNRIAEPIPEQVPWSELIKPGADVPAWWASHQRQMDYVGKAERIPITLPHAGESFHEDSLETLRERLLQLRQLGYRFPNSVLEEVVDEEVEEIMGKTDEQLIKEGIKEFGTEEKFKAEMQRLRTSILAKCGLLPN